MQNQFDNIARLLDIPAVCIIAFLFLIGWSVVGALCNKTMRYIGAALAIVSVTVILYVTVLSRSVINANVYLIPFSTFQRAKVDPDLYRFMVLNLIMFMPVGCSLPFLLRGNTGKRILMTLLIGVLLSCLIETMQGVFSIGYTDTDDVIVNTLGTAIGSISYPLSLLIMKAAGKRLTADNRDEE